MKYRTLGKTGLNVSEIGMGCGGRIGMPEYTDAEADRLLGLAADMGINFLDTGSNYALGGSERRLGRLLKHRRKDFLLATKCGSRLIEEPGREPDVKRDFTYDGLLKSIQDSLTRLQTDSVDLLQFHTATEAALNPDGEAMAALFEAKKRGYARFLGASCDGDRALQAIACGKLDAIQISFNVASQTPLERILPQAKAANIGVIVKEPAANAFFCHRPKPDPVEYGWQIPTWERAQHFTFLTELPSPSPVQAALQFVLADAAVTTAIVATTHPGHLQENAKVPDLPPLSKSLYQKTRNTFLEKVK